MNELLSKLSSYNIFNYLFPGAVYVAVCNYLGLINIDETNILIGAFVVYFIGMTISRIGSVFVEFLAIKFGLVQYADYSEYLDAKKDDDQIEILLEQNNVYRTILALLICVLATFFSHLIILNNYISKNTIIILIIILLLFIYAMAFKKQTSYILKRVNKSKNK
jgi:hypothetical protein